MGKRLNNRKISKDRVKKIRKRKNKIIIALEGSNKTEKIYFSNFDTGTESYSIMIAKENTTDPLNLVKSLDREISKLDLDLINGDKAFCVFDTDIDINKNKVIKEAQEFAKQKRIEIISSTPCFELWYLLHFEYTTANLSNIEVIKRLKKYYPKYEKNINIFPDIKNNINLAIKRAKLLEKYQIENQKQINSVEANPNTEIYKIVEYLIKNA